MGKIVYVAMHEAPYEGGVLIAVAETPEEAMRLYDEHGYDRPDAAIWTHHRNGTWTNKACGEIVPCEMNGLPRH